MRQPKESPYNPRSMVFFAALLLTCTGLPVAAQPGAETEADGNQQPSEQTIFPQQLPDQYPVLQQMAVRALAEDNAAEFVRILEHSLNLRPYDHRIMVQLVAGYALQGAKSKAYNLMLQMQQQGIGFDFNSIPQTQGIRATESYAYINNLLIKNHEGYAGSERAFTLPVDDDITDAMVFDAKHQHFIFGTIRQPSIHVLDAQGQPVANAPDFNAAIDYSVFDLAIDAKRRQLWVSTSAVAQRIGYKSSDFGKNALLQFALDSGKLLASFRIQPDGSPHGMGNIALADDGTVYLADLRSPAIYRLQPGDTELSILAVGSALPDIHGIALNEKDNLLYLADQHRGLAFIDLKDNKPYLMGAPETLNLGGIEGIDYWNNHLIIIQPGMRPARVMQILLANNGRNIVTSEAKDANHPDFLAPNFGVVANDAYYFMAVSHWSAYDLHGNRLPGSKVGPVPVLKFNLQTINPDEQYTPDLQDILRNRARQQQDRQTPDMLLQPEPDQSDDDS